MVDYEAVLSQYNRSVELHPHDPAALSQRGAALHSLGQYEEALRDYNRALELRPDDAETLSNRGVALHKLGRYQEALDDYNRALALRPDDPGTLSNRGVVLHSLGRYEEALADYNRALGLYSDDPSILGNRGLTLHSLVRYEEALADYNRALALQPDDVDLLTNRGITLYSLGRYGEALADYNRSLALRPEDSEAPDVWMPETEEMDEEEADEDSDPLDSWIPETGEADEIEPEPPPSPSNGAVAGKLCNWCHKVVELSEGATATDGICTACVLKLVQRSFISGVLDDEDSPADTLEEDTLSETPPDPQPVAQETPPDPQPVAQETPPDPQPVAQEVPPVAPATAQSAGPATTYEAPVERQPAPPQEPPEDQESRAERSEMQWLLLRLGNDLGFDVRLADDDRDPDASGSQTPGLAGTKPELPYQPDEAAQKAMDAIDVLWMKGRRAVAAFEITSKPWTYPGLLKLSDLMAVSPHPAIPVYLVAPEDCYHEVAAEVNRPTFALLSPPMSEACRFISFSDLRELVSHLGRFVRYLRPDFLEDLARGFEAAGG